MRSDDTPTTTPESTTIRLTDAGLETVMIFEEGLDLPEFAAFPLVADATGRSALHRYYGGFIELAEREQVEIVLDTPTWRASTAWGSKLGYDADALAAANADAVRMLHEIRASAPGATPVVVSGCIGSWSDGYRADARITVEEAHEYHMPQVTTLARHGVDLVTALTMTNTAEATGLALAAGDVGVPVVISFTVETDGRLPSGETLAGAIETVDNATAGLPIHYGINCAHPDHFVGVLDPSADWAARIGLVRSNASRLSHAELDEAEELDAGDPHEWGGDVADLRHRLPALRTIGGCCGTDHRHIAAVARATAVADAVAR